MIKKSTLKQLQNACEPYELVPEIGDHVFIDTSKYTIPGEGPITGTVLCLGPRGVDILCSHDGAFYHVAYEAVIGKLPGKYDLVEPPRKKGEKPQPADVPSEELYSSFRKKYKEGVKSMKCWVKLSDKFKEDFPNVAIPKKIMCTRDDDDGSWNIIDENYAGPLGPGQPLNEEYVDRLMRIG